MSDLAKRIEAGEDIHELNLELGKLYADVPDDAFIHSQSKVGVWKDSAWANGKDWGTCPDVMRSLDAAVNLLEAVLPGWHYQLNSYDEVCCLWPNLNLKDSEMVAGQTCIPAASMVAAIVRAKARVAGEDNRTNVNNFGVGLDQHQSSDE